MDSGENSNRSSLGASRPPRQEFTEDTPLFTDVSSTPSRRTPNSGRPESPSASRRTPVPPAAKSNPYGGRTSVPRTSQQRPQRDSRTAPVYTELSWNDISRTTDYSALGRPAQPSAPPRSAPAQPHGGSGYFGGFEQERDRLFYNDPSSGPDRTAYGAPMNGAPTQSAPVFQTQPPVNGAADPGASSPRISGNGQERQYLQRYAARPTVPLQSIRQTAYRQATRSNARQSRAGAAPDTGRPVRGSGNTPPPANGGNHAHYASRSRGSRIHPLFYLGGAILLALVIFGLAKLAGGSGAKPVATIRPASTMAVPTPTPDNALAQGVGAEATPAVTPTPTPAPTATPSGPKARLLGDLVVPADWGPSIPERKRAVFDSFFDRSIMIGNSMVDGFRSWADMPNIRYVFGTGATVANAIGGLDLSPLTLNASDYYNNVFLMFGLNEIGTDVNSFVQHYKRLVDFVREHQTKANIIIVSVTPVTRQVDEDPNEVQKMDRIRIFNAALQEFCLDQNCWYLDIYNMMLDSNGYLSGDYAFVGDGKHFEKSGYVAWANYMKLHYVDDGLLTE